MKILHLYSGSQASGGLYLKEIVDGLDSIGSYEQKTIVSTYYPFESDSKVFFKFTDLASNVKKTKIRLIIRYLEFIYGLLYSLIYILKFKPNILNYSLNSSYKIEFWFLKSVKKFTKTQIYITCHDVVPFKNKAISFDNDLLRRKAFFDLADALIVHNAQSKLDLNKYYNQNFEKILFHSFPIMDMNKLNIDENLFTLKEKFDFCFLGHLRQEKGLSLLLEAWKIFNKNHPDAKLIIAGNKASSSLNLDVVKLDSIGITLIEKYLPDSLYFNIIKISKNIVLPYLKGTNSGILSTIISTDINIISSDIAMFKTHPLIDENYIFKSNNVDSLLNKMETAYTLELSKEIRTTQLANYKKEFIQELKLVYK